MAIEPRNFDHLVGTLKGFSEKQITQHLGLYRGYVTKYNEIQDKLGNVDRGAANYSFGEFSELRRREAVAYNGAYLHELYFENMSPQGGQGPAGDLRAAIEREFGSVDAWEKDLLGCGTSTPGWVLLCHNRTDDRLHHYIMFEHHIGLPVHVEPVLAMDCWEHAFMIDYGTGKMDYMKAFLGAVDWKVCADRFVRAGRMLAAAK